MICMLLMLNLSEGNTILITPEYQSKKNIPKVKCVLLFDIFPSVVFPLSFS